MITNGVVTVFSPDRSTGRLLCKGTFPAWTHCEKRMRNDGAGVYSDDRFDVRIQLGCVEDISIGDLIFLGRAEAGCVQTGECKRISTVTCNETGSSPHWHLKAEYIYR